MADVPVILGIDAGGTSSRAAIWAGGFELARTEGAALNPNHVGVERSVAHLRALIAGLPMRIRIPPGMPPIDAACVGFSGLSHPSSRSIVKAAFETATLQVSGPRILVGDAELVLQAAFGDARPSGVAVVCGTGTIALARTSEGSLVRAGGRGPAGGDQGGGHWIGARAIERGLVAAAGALRPAELAPRVVLLAAAGDPIAAGIIRDAAAEISLLALGAAAQAGLGEGFLVRPSGGVIAHAPMLFELLAGELARAPSRARLGPLVADALEGARSLAAGALASGSGVPPGW